MRFLAVVAVLVFLACDASQPEKPHVMELSQQEFMSQAPGSYLVLDVRTPEEFAAGHLDKALNISHDRLADQLPQIQQYAATPVLLYCRSGNRAAKAAEVLAKAGFTNLHHLTGDMQGWEAAGLPVVKDGS